VGELAAPFDMTFAAVSKHLGVLENAGLVSRGRTPSSGRQLDARPLAAASRWIGDYARVLGGQPRLPRSLPERPAAAGASSIHPRQAQKSP
jgi:DNA-binding transcriptional ArsR family regulator